LWRFRSSVARVGELEGRGLEVSVVEGVCVCVEVRVGESVGVAVKVGVGELEGLSEGVADGTSGSRSASGWMTSGGITRSWARRRRQGGASRGVKVAVFCGGFGPGVAGGRRTGGRGARSQGGGRVCVCVEVNVGLALGVAVNVAVGELEGLAEGVADDVGLAVSVGLDDGVAVELGEGLADEVRVGFV